VGCHGPTPRSARGSFRRRSSTYWALKSLGEPAGGSALSAARRFVLAHGGLEAVDPASAPFLALIGT